MNFLSLFSPTGIMATLIIALSISNVVFIKLYGSVNRDYANFQAAVEAANREAAAENERRDTEARGNTARVAELYAADTDRIRTVYVSRLDGVLRQLSRCQAQPAPAVTTGEGDERPTDGGLAAGGYESEVRRLEADCAQTTLQFYGLRAYVRGLCSAYRCGDE